MLEAWRLETFWFRLSLGVHAVHVTNRGEGLRVLNFSRRVVIFPLSVLLCHFVTTNWTAEGMLDDT